MRNRFSNESWSVSVVVTVSPYAKGAPVLISLWPRSGSTLSFFSTTPILLSMTPELPSLPDKIPSLEEGAAVIRGYLKDMPTGPGVYRMLDGKGLALYVGKARNLKARVSNYAQSSGGHAVRTRRMIAQTKSMEIVTTRSEAEALLLEANLVKRLQPRYNVLLRDDKSYRIYSFLPTIPIRSWRSTAARATVKANISARSRAFGR